MASSNFTTHYSIPTPLGTDLTTPMDYNEAAEAVDVALFGAVTDAGNAAEAAGEAVYTANTASEVAEGVRADLALEKAKIIQLQTRMTAAENNIDDVYTDVTDMITAYKEPSATSTRAYAIGDYFIYNETLYKATDAIAIDETIVPNTNCDTTNVSSELIQINSALSAIGDTITLSGSQSDVANNMFVSIVNPQNIPAGTYIVHGWINFAASNSTGSRAVKFASSSYNGKEIEVSPNQAGYTQLMIDDIVTFDSVTNTFSLQAKQTSGDLMNISGQIKLVRVK